MAEIEQTTDNDIAEVHQSKTKFGSVSGVIQPVANLFSLLTAERMLGIFEDAPKKSPDLRKLIGKPEKQLAKARADLEKFERAASFGLVLDGTLGEPIDIASGNIQIASDELRQRFAAQPPETAEQDSLFPGLATSDQRRVMADALVRQARALTAEHGFFHWEIGFPSVWSDLTSASPRGGFDAVIGNPPYVRQELLGPEVKRALKGGFTSFNGMADLYVYFYEQGLRLLKPGGRMSYVVTNKWLKAGYAEELRGVFADKGWLEFIADFGHAKHFFPGADVFPCVLVVQKPVTGQDAPDSSDVCVIPRALVPKKGLQEAVKEATFPLPRLTFTKEAWVLEPKPVMDLLDKIRRNGVPLADYAGVKPLYGIKTGFNEAFLIDTPKRNQLLQADPRSAEIIRPYLRGQDIDRWHSEWDGLWMIFARRGINIDDFPAVKAHLEAYRTQLEPKPATWQPTHPDDKWPGRKEGSYAWYEVQDPVDYWQEFQKPKIMYQVIQFYPSYAFDEEGRLGNDKTFVLPTPKKELLAVLNAPLMWWFNWRNLPHLKDEALSPMGYLMEMLPVPRLSEDQVKQAVTEVDELTAFTKTIRQNATSIHDWLRTEFSLEKPGTALSKPHTLDADGFVAAVRAALPKKQRLSAAQIQELKREHGATIEPARLAAAEALQLERRLSTLVNAAYGLTPEEVQLMWDTAPPRMPFTP